MRRVLLILGAVLTLILGGAAAFSLAADTTASCTQSPVVTDTDTVQSFTIECSVPKPAPVTETVTVPGPTTTVTVTATPEPSTTPKPSTTPTVEPTPTVTPTPTATPTVTPPTGFPNADNTGVPAGVTLTPAGSMTISTAGTVIDGKDMGCLTVTAANVTVKNTRIRCGAFWAVTVKGKNFTMIDSEVDGTGTSEGNSGVVANSGGEFTLTRVDIKGAENAVVPGDNTTIQDSWLHALKSVGSPHYDAVEINGGAANVTIRHNTIDNPFTQTSAVMIANDYGAVTNFLVTGNKLTGGGYTVYADGKFSTTAAINGAFTNNVIGKGYYGYALIRGTNTNVTWSGNTDATTGKPVSR